MNKIPKDTDIVQNTNNANCKHSNNSICQVAEKYISTKWTIILSQMYTHTHMYTLGVKNGQEELLTTIKDNHEWQFARWKGLIAPLRSITHYFIWVATNFNMQGQVQSDFVYRHATNSSLSLFGNSLLNLALVVKTPYLN